MSIALRFGQVNETEKAKSDALNQKITEMMSIILGNLSHINYIAQYAGIEALPSYIFAIDILLAMYQEEVIQCQDETEKNIVVDSALLPHLRDAISYLTYLYANKKIYMDYIPMVNQNYECILELIQDGVDSYVEICSKIYSPDDEGKLIIEENPIFPRVKTQYKDCYCGMFGFIFSGGSMYMELLTGSFKGNFSKNSSYRRLNNSKIHWQKFTTVLSSEVINSFVPVNSCLLAGNKADNLYVDANECDGRSIAGKHKAQSKHKATEVMIELLDSAKAAGLSAKYVLVIQNIYFPLPSGLEKRMQKPFLGCTHSPYRTHIRKISMNDEMKCRS